MSVLRDLTNQGLAIALGHPVLGLDLDASINARLKGKFLLAQLASRAQSGGTGLDHLCIHEAVSSSRGLLCRL